MTIRAIAAGTVAAAATTAAIVGGANEVKSRVGEDGDIVVSVSTMMGGTLGAGLIAAVSADTAREAVRRTPMAGFGSDLLRGASKHPIAAGIGAGLLAGGIGALLVGRGNDA